MKYTIIYYDGNENKKIIIENPYDDICKINPQDIVEKMVSGPDEIMDIIAIIEGMPEVRLVSP